MAANPDSALSAGNSPDYIDELLAFLGDRDPLAAFSATPGTLDAVVKGLSAEQLNAPEKPGKWSVADVIQHLADVEIVIGFRYRKVLGEHQPDIAAYDQDTWVDAFRDTSIPVQQRIDDFRAVRDINLRLLRSLTDEQWQRWGMHNERGKETMEHMVRLYAAHDCCHLAQIERIKQAVGAS